MINLIRGGNSPIVATETKIAKCTIITIGIPTTDEVINIAQLTEKSTKITEVILNPTRIGYTSSSVAAIFISVMVHFVITVLMDISGLHLLAFLPIPA